MATTAKDLGDKFVASYAASLRRRCVGPARSLADKVDGVLPVLLIRLMAQRGQQLSEAAIEATVSSGIPSTLRAVQHAIAARDAIAKARGE